MSEGNQSPSSIFLERQTYRQRRRVDMVKLMPVLGVVLFFLPVLWAGSGKTSSGLMYLFLAWAVLIVAMAVLARAVTRGRSDLDPETDDRRPPADRAG